MFCSQRLYSSVVERCTCNAAAPGSNPGGAFLLNLHFFSKIYPFGSPLCSCACEHSRECFIVYFQTVITGFKTSCLYLTCLVYHFWNRKKGWGFAHIFIFYKSQNSMNLMNLENLSYLVKHTKSSKLSKI